MKKFIFLSLILSSIFLSSCLPLLAAAGAGYVGKDKYKKVRKYINNAKAIYDIIKNNDEIKTALRETRCVAIYADTGDILMDGVISKNVGKLLLSGFSLLIKTNKNIEISKEEKNKQQELNISKKLNEKLKNNKNLSAEKENINEDSNKKLLKGKVSSNIKKQKEIKERILEKEKNKEENNEQIKIAFSLKKDKGNVSEKTKDNTPLLAKKNSLNKENSLEKNKKEKDNNKSSPKLELCEPGHCKCERYVLIKIYTQKDKITNENITYLSFSIIKRITRFEL